MDIVFHIKNNRIRPYLTKNRGVSVHQMFLNISLRNVGYYMGWTMSHFEIMVMNQNTRYAKGFPKFLLPVALLGLFSWNICALTAQGSPRFKRVKVHRPPRGSHSSPLTELHRQGGLYPEDALPGRDNPGGLGSGRPSASGLHCATGSPRPSAVQPGVVEASSLSPMRKSAHLRELDFREINQLFA